MLLMYILLICKLFMVTVNSCLIISNGRGRGKKVFYSA